VFLRFLANGKDFWAKFFALGVEKRTWHLTRPTWRWTAWPRLS